MDFPWEILIAAVVFLVAYLLNNMFKDMIEDQQDMYLVIAGFFVLYAIAAFGISLFAPAYARPSSIASIVDQLTSLAGTNEFPQ